MYNIKPLITEKSVSQSTKGEYTLLVPMDYTKEKILAAVKIVFKVTPLAIRTSTKKLIVAKKIRGYQKERGYKKAIIKLDKKQTIPGFQTFAEELSKSQEADAKTETKNKAEAKNAEVKTQVKTKVKTVKDKQAKEKND